MRWIAFEIGIKIRGREEEILTQVINQLDTRRIGWDYEEGLMLLGQMISEAGFL